MKRLLLVLVSALALTVGSVAIGLTSPDTAAARSGFNLTLKYNVTSHQDTGTGFLIGLSGRGHSSELGSVTSTSTVTITFVPGPCWTRTADETWSTKSGTVQIHSDGQQCGSQVSGEWDVMGGTGDLAGASGGGTFVGARGSQGNVALSYSGSFSS